MSKKIYYKIVRKDENKYISSFIDDGNKVEYKLNEYVGVSEFKTVDDNYHLLVFDSFENAKNFIAFFDQLIFKCKIKGIIKNIPERKVCMDGIYSNIKDVNEWPKGTIMAKAVKIYGKPYEI